MAYSTGIKGGMSLVDNAPSFGVSYERSPFYSSTRMTYDKLLRNLLAGQLWVKTDMEGNDLPGRMVSIKPWREENWKRDGGMIDHLGELEQDCKETTEKTINFYGVGNMPPAMASLIASPDKLMAL
ncbi:hypothetical protein C0J52_11634 [Blattella germanica]|nr:hypothetical protein C0J52_11634 [Blattella germanica]